MEPLFKWISVASRQTQMYLNKQLEPYGINASQHMFIKHICRNPGITQDKLPELVAINKSNVTRALAQLEQAGFIIRKANSKDRRTARLYPSEKATEIYPAVMEIVNTWDCILTGKLSLDEKELLRALLIKVSGTASAFVTDGGE